ncbi:aminopeptidase P N-terminal domain-containing protein [Mucilaginibacter sp. BJC16-A38]|uniref:aminopeptidase P family protein n=1 Tax=Mucilaginibacter phenanthrenivorans TaxID=1234842 RepID=UPI002156F70C|nr:aminopeptidase P family protein [Mucilaginibacter phenanthrenivorans]MCR8558558.1 aminopeptidase P N-terminal domain-containing protein [Mucilaginibacter phenanthrenivorans]
MELHLFDKQVYTNRRQILKQNIGADGLILLMGNEDSSMNYKDNTYLFRQDSSFLYYFGLDTHGLTAIIDTDTGEEVIFGNELTIDDIVWTGTLPTVSEMAAMVGVTQTKPYDQVTHYIHKAITSGRPVHILPPYRPENKIKLAAWLNTSLADLAKYVSVKLIKAVIAQRVIKTPLEVAELEKAVNISVDMELAVIKHTRPGIKEYELVAKAHEVAIANNARLGYPAIITTHGQTLHTHYYGNTLQEGRMVLSDIGAENAMHYGGDLTRTFPVGKSFTTRQSELYQVVLNSMDHAISMLKPGVRYKDIHLAACQKLVEGLAEVNIMKGDAAEAVEAGAHTMFFQCGLGHMLGMDTHDMEDLGEQYVGYTDSLKKETSIFGLKSLRLGRELEAGFVLTVEPGIYIIPELIDRWQADDKYADFINYDVLNTYRDFGGIRIEDNFLITDTGSQLLGKYLPKTLKEIEGLKG